MRRFPGSSVTGVCQVPLAFHVIVAPLGVPVSSARKRGDVRTAPVAWFHPARADTPAFSSAPMTAELEPAKSTLIAPRPAPVVFTLTTTGLAWWLVTPLVPRTSSQKLPVGAVAGTVTVIAPTPDPIMDEGLKEIAVPRGCPVADRSTRSANPFCEATVTENVALVPGGITRPPGATVTAKSDGRSP